jgi:hypothetical protein
VTARRAIVLLAQAIVYVFAFAVAAHAQSSGDEPPLDDRLRGFLLRLPDQTKDVVPPTEAERSQEEVRRAQERARRSPREAQPSRSGPGYIGPLSTETSTGRMGASGWTSPAVYPPGSGGTLEEKAGQFGFGYSVEWGVPRRPEAP